MNLLRCDVPMPMLKKAIPVFLILVFLIAGSHTTKAQLCTGSLGDAVVNITFGTGPNFGVPLSSTTNGYTYQAASCPDDGHYTIANSSPQCFSNTWQVLTEDHTPSDVDGYMFIVNASHVPGDFYVQKVDDLCAGTTYEMAAWILNIAKCTFATPILPNVTFQVETTGGAVLMRYNTGDIPQINSPVWKQYGSFFTLPASTSSVIIRLTNNAGGGCGNDLVLDDITFRPCGVTVTSSIAGPGTFKMICTGDTSTLRLSANTGTGSFYYQWEESTDSGKTWSDIPGANALNYSLHPPQVPGKYQFRIGGGQNINTAATCRILSNVSTLVVNDVPQGAITSNHPACEGDSIRLTAPDGQLYAWSGPGGYTSTTPELLIPVSTVNHTGKYVVNITSDKGCVASDSIQVLINKKPIANVSPHSMNICAGQSVALGGGMSSGSHYLWQPVLGLSSDTVLTPTASPQSTTLYRLTVYNGTCTTTDTVLLNVFRMPVINAGPDKIVMEGENTVLSGSLIGNDLSFTWNPPSYLSSANLLQPIANPSADISYILHVTSDHGCGSSSDTMMIKVLKKIVTPNVFTPNSDGINDTWKVKYLTTYPGATVDVFTRYGNPVYIGSGKTEWNGTHKGVPVPVGVYYYIIDLKIFNLRYVGWVTIIR